MKKEKLLIVDDHRPMRVLYRHYLDDEDDIELVAEAANGKEALEILEKQEVDLVLTDVSMPVMDGYELTAAIRKQYAGLPVLIVTMHDEPNYIRYLVDAGVSGYVLKESGKEALLEAIRSVLKTGEYFPDNVQKAVRAEPAPKPGMVTTRLTLTPEELYYLELVVEGVDVEEIGRLLAHSPEEFRDRIANLKQKTGSQSAADLAEYALRHKLLPH